MKKINVKINPNLEFINSILLTSKYNKITKPYIGYGLMTEEHNQYTDSIRNFFRPFQELQIYSEIESMIPNGFTFSRPVELMLALGESNDFSIQYPLSELCVQYCGGTEKISTLLKNLYEFSRKINYLDFFEKSKSYYDAYMLKMESHVQSHPFIFLLESMYGVEQKSYNYIPSSLMVGSFGINFVDKECLKSDLFSVFTLQSKNDTAEADEFDNGAFSMNTLFHEFSHPFINPLTEKYFDITKQYSSAYKWLEKHKLPNYGSGYGDWQECINEHFVRAMAIYLMRKCDRNQWADKHLENNLRLGYKYIPAILQLYKHYENNRKTYKTFDDFYPTLLKVFKDAI